MTFKEAGRVPGAGHGASPFLFFLLSPFLLSSFLFSPFSYSPFFFPFSFSPFSSPFLLSPFHLSPFLLSPFHLTLFSFLFSPFLLGNLSGSLSLSLFSTYYIFFLTCQVVEESTYCWRYTWYLQLLLILENYASARCLRKVFALVVECLF
jgi:hypothetical protein